MQLQQLGAGECAYLEIKNDKDLVGTRPERADSYVCRLLVISKV